MTMPSQTLTEGFGRAAIRRADRSIKQSALNSLVRDYGLNFVYLRNYYLDTGEVCPLGGMVVCYRIPVSGGTVLEVSTSLCSDKDVFDKLEGKFQAANSFASGKKINMRVAPGGTYSKQLKMMFAPHVNAEDLDLV